jgi:hypothetical protein
MLHTLGKGTWEVQASFDGTEVLIFYGENKNSIAFRMDDNHSRAVMMHWISQHLQLKSLVDVAPINNQPPTPHTKE